MHHCNITSIQVGRADTVSLLVNRSVRRDRVHIISSEAKESNWLLF